MTEMGHEERFPPPRLRVRWGSSTAGYLPSANGRHRPHLGHFGSWVEGDRASHDRWSNHNSLDLIEAHLVAPAIVELRRARRGMVPHRSGLPERAAILEIGGDPGRPEAVISEPGRDACRGRAPADHRIGVRLRPHPARELAGAA